MIESFFYSLQLDKNLKARTWKEIDSEQVSREERLLIELYYTTGLDIGYLAKISTEVIRAKIQDEWMGQLPHETLIRLRQQMSQAGSLLFGSGIHKMNQAGLEELLKKNLEAEFVRELKSTRVICRKEEYTILPTPLRLDADPAYTGKGICIGFLDGGFYPHPDIMKPYRRVVAYKDLGSPNAAKSNFEKPDIHSWHGMQTCVSAVGNGYLSNGLYKGIASEANVALLKVMGQEGFTTEAIISGIEWAIRKQKRYNLRILNISLGAGDEAASFRESSINHAAEEAIQAGINVVVAAGNESWMRVTPPGNSPSVITVGGLDDRNSLESRTHNMYHSSYGVTADGILKPEIIAPGIWVAAPTLPGTEFYREAELVWELAHARTAKHFEEILDNYNYPIPFFMALQGLDFQGKKNFMEQKVREFKLISPHYQHVDGTSFSAPIVCSIIAQMLEANASLSPENVKEILMQTAKRLENVPVERQGCGVVQAKEAVRSAKKRVLSPGFSYPQIRDNKVTLRYRGDAQTVEVLGSFNQWKDGTPMQKEEGGVWSVELEFEDQGTHAYKFLVDKKHWMDDPDNISKVYDGFGGFNSQFVVYGTPAIRKSLERVESALDKIKSIRFQSEEHREALFEMDRILAFPAISKSPQLKDFFERRMLRVLNQLKVHDVEDGLLIHQMYNGGYILETPTLNLGIDVVSCQHVWDMYWKIRPDVFPEITRLLDIAFVTHRLPDHLDLDIVNRMISDDKLVIVPSGMENLCLNGVIGFEAWEKRELYSLGPYDMSIQIEALPGRYRYPMVTDIDMRSFRISITEKLNLLVLGEVDNRSALQVIRQAGKDFKTHLLFVPLPISDETRDLDLFYQLIEEIQPDVILPSCIGELAQKDALARSSYRRAWELLSRTGREFEILGWGDSVKVGFRGA
ncbi:MAG: S8 family serine peptidase [Candidatus Cloacimonetes bacterium]|nr:S8 family serine peptidase [Candidatus Cloacimonadota bacterium]